MEGESVEDEKQKRTERDALIKIEEIDGSKRTYRRKLIFCRDVITESIKFLQLRNVLLLSETNRRVLGGPCERRLELLCPPRIIGPLRMDFDFNGVRKDVEVSQGIPASLPFPQVPLPQDMILGFGRITICWTIQHMDLFFGSTNTAHILARVCDFLSLSKRLLCQHDLLLTGLGRINEFTEAFAHSVFSQLSDGVRIIETDTGLVRAELLKSEAFRATNRLLFTDNFFNWNNILTPTQFDACVEWLHFPTKDGGATRTLIFFTHSPQYGFVRTFVRMIVELFESEGENVKGPSSSPPPKFCVIVLFPGESLCVHLDPIYRMNKERGDALLVEPIRDGSDRFERPFLELVTYLDGGIESYPIGFLCGYILRRDVAVGPWTRPEMFEARRYHPVPEEHKLIQFI